MLQEQINRMRQLTGLSEAALPDTYYHGTDKEDIALQILQQGMLRPGNKPGKGMLTPIMGRLYATKDLRMAVIYALGGVMMGHKYDEKHWRGSPYGYVFQTKEVDDVNVLPDEDEIGELVHDNKIPALTYLARQHLTDNQMRKVMSGEYAYWAQAGKKLIKIISPQLKAEILQHTKNIAHNGELQIVHAWKIHKSQAVNLTENCENFFTLATQVL